MIQTAYWVAMMTGPVFLLNTASLEPNELTQVPPVAVERCSAQLGKKPTEVKSHPESLKMLDCWFFQMGIYE